MLDNDWTLLSPCPRDGDTVVLACHTSFGWAVGYGCLKDGQPAHDPFTHQSVELRDAELATLFQMAKEGVDG